MTTNLDQIPEWGDYGTLPPHVRAATSPENRSPYRVSLVDMILHFGNTGARLEILGGFLDFRDSLRQAGLVDGFQWVNGSFVEDTRLRVNPEPNDIDVVTFFQVPAGMTELALFNNHPDIFQPNAKARYGVDSYLVPLETDDIRNLTGWITYWNSLWSHTGLKHRRGPGIWKGYLELDLANSEDAAARDILNAMAG